MSYINRNVVTVACATAALGAALLVTGGDAMAKGGGGHSAGGTSVSKVSMSGPIVRDHRTPTAQPVVRDHRTATAQPVVRDHRTATAQPVVRDHRTPTVTTPPVVRPPVIHPPVVTNPPVRPPVVHPPVVSNPPVVNPNPPTGPGVIVDPCRGDGCRTGDHGHHQPKYWGSAAIVTVAAIETCSAYEYQRQIRYVPGYGPKRMLVKVCIEP
jgi:hypothetical protein